MMPHIEKPRAGLFQISRTSEWSGEVSPHPRAFQATVTHTWTSGPVTVTKWWIEISDLVQFVNEIDEECVVIPGEWPKIEIYDDYRE